MLVPDTPEHQAGLVRALQQHVTQALLVIQTIVSQAQVVRGIIRHVLQPGIVLRQVAIVTIPLRLFIPAQAAVLAVLPPLVIPVVLLVQALAHQDTLQQV